MATTSLGNSGKMKTTCEENSISLYKIEPCTSNAVDFNICYHIGTMTHKCTNFYIVSDDNGFKAVKNLAATQNITITLLNQKPTKTQPNNCNHEQRMIAYLKSRHNNQATSVDFGTELSPKLHNLGSVQKFLQTTDCFTQNNSIIKLKA
jgi:hypothetical protein